MATQTTDFFILGGVDTIPGAGSHRSTKKNPGPSQNPKQRRLESRKIGTPYQGGKSIKKKLPEIRLAKVMSKEKRRLRDDPEGWQHQGRTLPKPGARHGATNVT